MKQMMKDAMILFLITLISGAALGLVYEVTKEPIAQQEQKAKNEAYQNVFEAAEDFTELTEETYSPDALTAFVKENGFDASIDGVAQALSGDGSVLGYVITVTDHEGYGGDIQFTMGVADDGTLNGISLLSISETAGLGMRATEPEFYNQYAEKKTDKIEFNFARSVEAAKADLAASVNENAPAERIEALTDSVANDTYDVSPEAIADSKLML